MAYVTLAELRTYVGTEITGDDAFLADVLLDVEQEINEHCARDFNIVNAAADPTTRNYVPCGDLVIVHDIANATGLEVSNDGATVAASDYQLEPLNNLSAGGATVPFHQIRLINSCWTRDGKRATVSVTTDQWGWAAVPPQVKEATRILGKDTAHMRQIRFGIAGFGDYAVARLRDNPTVVQKLARLRHPRAIGIA